ncbi:MAG: type II toxin-antitoxin system death-on-curing family toxin [Dermatophilaceae bacterium]
MTEYLRLEDLLALVEDLGVGPIRDVGLLDSASARPASSIFGRDAYGDLDHKAAALLESLVRNHALVDGNKRLGWLALVVFYGLNGVDLEVDDDLAYDLVIHVASGNLDVPRVAATFAVWRSQQAAGEAQHDG